MRGLKRVILSPIISRLRIPCGLYGALSGGRTIQMCGQMPSGAWRTKQWWWGAWGIQSGDPRIWEENGKWSDGNQSKTRVTQMTKDKRARGRAVPPDVSAARGASPPTGAGDQ